MADANGYTLYATFDQNAGPNEAHLSSGDSGGAVFINDGGVWTLAGISFSVDGPFSTTPGGTGFNAVLFDARGFYNLAGQLISSNVPAPSGFYALRISDRLSWIWSIVFPGTPLPTPAPTPNPTPAPTVAPTPTPIPPPDGPAQMFNPAPGSTFTSFSASFSWSAANASAYKLYVGNSPGAADICNSGKLSVRSLAVNNIPTIGSNIYVRLWSKMGRTWRYVDYTYKGYSYNPTSAPTPTPTPTPNRSATPTPRPSPTAAPFPTPRPRPTPRETGK